MIIFVIDILFNFFVAYEISDNDNGIEIIKDYNLNNIIFNYLTSWFMIDLLSTIPLEFLFDWIIINTQIIKSVKLVRAVKLIRILKFAKLFSFFNMNYMTKSETGKVT